MDDVISIASGIVSPLVGLITIGKLSFELYAKINSGGYFFLGASHKKIEDELDQAKHISSKGFASLGSGIEKQIAKDIAHALAKKETGFYLGSTATTLLVLAIMLMALLFLAGFAKVQENLLVTLIFQIFALVFFFLLLLMYFLVMYDVSNFLDAYAKFKDRKERKKSRSEGLSLYHGELVTYAERYNSYVLIDARSEAAQKKRPIKNTISTPENLSDFSNKLTHETAVFACSDFGRESYLVCRELENLGIENCYDLGGIKGRETVINRSMIELSYRNMGPLGQDNESNQANQQN